MCESPGELGADRLVFMKRDNSWASSTSSSGSKVCVGVVFVPESGFIKCLLDVVHIREHISRWKERAYGSDWCDWCIYISYISAT